MHDVSRQDIALSDAVVVLCTAPDEATAQDLAAKVLAEKLAACATIIPGAGEVPASLVAVDAAAGAQGPVPVGAGQPRIQAGLEHPAPEGVHIVLVQAIIAFFLHHFPPG